MKNPFYEIYAKNIRAELKSYIQENGIQSLILGVSGGADSTLIALLAKPVCDELDIPLLGYSMSISSNKSAEEQRARNIGSRFCNRFKEKDFSTLYHQMAMEIDETTHIGSTNTDEKIRFGNIKARIRMIFLYHQANKNKGMVLSTDNYTELLLGFWTLHGDVGDYGMIQELWKTEVYGMLEYIKDNEIEEEFEKIFIQQAIDATATDGLGITDSDLDQILPGFEGSSRAGYAQVDLHLMDPEKHKDSPAVERMNRTVFKRENPINLSREKIIKI